MTAVRPPIVARVDERLRATLESTTPLAYSHGALPWEDLPAHVRAASAVRRRGRELVIVQDDVNALALADERGRVRAVLLPRGRGGRRIFDDHIGNKRDKLDLEACAALPDGRLVAFGSGASGARETLVVLGEDESVRLVPGDELYARLRADRAFAGTELNVEGAVVLDRELLLCQRATGAPRAGTEAVYAIGALDLDAFLRWLDERAAPPRLTSVTAIELGRLDGKNFGITDAAVTADGRIALLGCAEDSPDALSDGAVVGCRVGLLDGDTLRVADVLDPDGRRVTLKLEGLEERPGSPLEFDVAVDRDRPDAPALLGRLRIETQG